MIRFALVLVLLCGCVPAEAIRQARTQAAVNLGHVNDETLPPEARLIGMDAYDAWSAQAYALAGDELPEDVAKRLRERGTLPEGWGE